MNRPKYLTTPKDSNLLRLFNSQYALYAYVDGKVEIVKNKRGGRHVGPDVPIESIVHVMADMIACNKFKETKNTLFQEALAEEIEKAVNKVLKGKYDDRTV